MRPLRRLTRTLIVAAAAVLVAVFFGDEITRMARDVAPAQGQGDLADISGPARIVDADSVEIADIPIRLIYIDACEEGQPARVGGREIDCGAWATAQMIDLVAGRPLRCVPAGTDRYERVLAECFLPDGRNVNLAAIRAGIAFLYTGAPASREARAAAETAAAAGVGVWSFQDVQDPAEYRRAQRERRD